MTSYRHTQIGWVILASLALPALIVAIVAASAHTWLILLALVPIVLVLPVFGWLTVVVDQSVIVARFGIGLIRLRIPLAEIAGITPVENSWWCGWGIRYLPGARLYNVSGVQAVELALADGRRVRIGTDDRDGLIAALHAARPNAPQTQATDTPLFPHAGLLVGGVVAMISVFAVVMISLGSRPVIVTTLDDAVAIDGRSYTARVPIAEITAVHLDETLPRIRWRTNGLAVGGALRGHFKLADGRSAQIFTTARRPPFVTLETVREPIIFNVEDPADTRALFQQLSSRVPSR